MMEVRGKYFYGNEISQEGQARGYVDYGTFAKAFDAVLNNGIMSATDAAGVGYWEPLSGCNATWEDTAGNIYTETEKDERIQELEDAIQDAEEKQESMDPDGIDYRNVQNDIDGMQADIDALDGDPYYPEVFQWYIVDGNGADICQEAGETVYYNAALDMYLWGVTHYGTAWAYVMTNIKCNTVE